MSETSYQFDSKASYIRSVILILGILFTFLISVATIVLLFLWLGIASKVEEYSTKMLEGLNKNPAVQQLGILDFTYESVEVSGFPSEFRIDITNPRFKIDYKKLIAASEHHHGTNTSIGAIDKWVDEHSFDGVVSLVKSSFSDTYSIKIEQGILNTKTYISNREPIEINTAYHTPTLIEIQFDNGTILPSFDIEKQLTELIDLTTFSSFVMQSGRITSEDAATKEKITSLESLDLIFNYSNYGSSITQKKSLGLKLNVKDLQWHEGMNKYVYDNPYFEQLSKKGSIDILNYINRGKINFTTDLTYKGNVDSISFRGNDYLIDLDINSLTWTDKAIRYSAVGSLRVTPSKFNIPNVQVTYTSAQDVTELGFDIALSNLQNISEELSHAPQAATSKHFQMFHHLIQDEPELLVPELHKFGTLRNIIDLAVTTDANGKVDVRIGNLGASNELFSVNVKGAASGQLLTGTGAGKVDIELKNFDVMFGYLRNYIVNIQNYMLNPRKQWQPDYIFSDEIFEAVRNTVLRFSNYVVVENGQLIHTHPDVLITAQLEKDKVPTIGNLDIIQAKQVLMTYLLPYLETGIVSR